MTRVPKGGEFLFKMSYQELKTMYKHEKSSKAKIRLQACMMRKRGKTLQEIAHEIEYPLTTIGDWLRRVHNKGLKRIHNKKQPGKKGYLTKNQKIELEKVLDKPPTEVGLSFKIWTTKILGHYLEQTYKVFYKIRKLQKLVHELGFTFKKARPEHRKANKKLQEAFKKTSAKTFYLSLKMDGRSYFLTRAYFK